MTFTVHVEHEVVGGAVVLEKFEGVEKFNNPPMTSTLHLTFAENRDDERLDYGNIVKAVSENE